MLVQADAADNSSALVAAAVPLAAVLVRSRLADRGRVGDALIVAGFALAFLPLPVAGVTGGTGLVFRVLAGLRNVGLVAAVFSNRLRAVRTAVLTSTALVMISFSLGNGWGMLGVTVLFAAVGVAWLVMTCWRDFAERMPPAAVGPAPWSWALLLGLLGGFSFFIGVLFYPAGASRLMQQYVGQDTLAELRARARGHVRQLANRRQFGNLADEKYGAASDKALEQGTQHEEGPGAGSTGQFPLVRQSRPAPLSGQERVLFRMKERGAGHVPMVTYSRLEDMVWWDEPASRHTQIAAEIVENRSWRSVFDPFNFSLDPDAQEMEDAQTEGGSAVERSRRGLAKLTAALQGGGRVISPQRTPLDLRRLQQLLNGPAGSVHPDYLLTPYDYAVIRRQLLRDYGQKGIERFESSLTFRRRVLEGYLATGRRHPEAVLPADLRALVESWVGDRPRGWEQIDALIQGLRSHVRHDPEATVPPSQADPIRYFLVESRRGPDYLFASAATVLLRHLGYPSRMVGGFYVRPGDYRLLSDSTPMTAGDLHYWTQVNVPNGLWINLEPTPGYEPTRPTYTVSERLAQMTGEVWSRWPPLLAGVVLVVGGVVLRRRLAERMATLGWRLRSGQSAGRLVRTTWRLIERRARTAGRQRGPGVTLPAWSAAVEAGAPKLGPPLATLADVADWITHAPPATLARLSRPETEIRAACHCAVRNCTVGALRQALSRHDPTRR